MVQVARNRLDRVEYEKFKGAVELGDRRSPPL